MFTLVSKTADDAVAVFQQRNDGDLHVNFNSLMDAVVLQCSDEFEPSAVPDVCKTRIAVAAKVSLVDAAIRRPVEHRSPALKFADAIRSLFGV